MCDVMSDNTYGNPPGLWEQAKKEAIRAIVTEGRNGLLITYSELTRHVRSIHFEAHDFSFHHLLGMISIEDDAAGRGMLSALVVHKDDGLPGSGFFYLAKRMGRDVGDRDRCWSGEVSFVLSHCKDHPMAA